MPQQLDDVVPVGPLGVIGVVAQDFAEVLVRDPHGGDVILGVMAAGFAPDVEEPAALSEGDQALVFAPGDVNQVERLRFLCHGTLLVLPRVLPAKGKDDQQVLLAVNADGLEVAVAGQVDQFVVLVIGLADRLLGIGLLADLVQLDVEGGPQDVRPAQSVGLDAFIGLAAGPQGLGQSQASQFSDGLHDVSFLA